MGLDAKGVTEFLKNSGNVQKANLMPDTPRDIHVPLEWRVRNMPLTFPKVKLIGRFRGYLFIMRGGAEGFRGRRGFAVSGAPMIAPPADFIIRCF
jgi:hypothetical protein